MIKKEIDFRNPQSVQDMGLTGTATALVYMTIELIRFIELVFSCKSASVIGINQHGVYCMIHVEMGFETVVGKEVFASVHIATDHKAHHIPNMALQLMGGISADLINKEIENQKSKNENNGN